MKKQRDYTTDIAEIRSMMERSSKFLSLAGWAGIMAGIYALTGALIAIRYLGFFPVTIAGSMDRAATWIDMWPILLLAAVVLVLSIGTAVLLTARKAIKRGEVLWNTSTKLLVLHMAVPLCAGGLLMLAIMFQGLTGLLLPLSLIFYGLALYGAGKYTYGEVRVLGLVQLGLGIAAAFFVAWSVYFWMLGFGFAHIIYGIYMRYSYER